MPKRWIYIPSASGSAPATPSTYSALFNGSDEYVKIANGPPTATNEAWSISYWFKFATQPSAQVSIFQQRKTGSTGSGLNCFFLTGGLPGLYLGDTPGANIQGYYNAALSLNTWHHVVITYSGSKASSGIKIYTDNVSRTVTESSSGTLASEDFKTEMDIGRHTGSIAYFPGQLGAIYKIPWELDADEVGELYGNGSNIHISSFLGWATMKASTKSLAIDWAADTFNSADGVVDLSDNAYKGSATNMSDAANKLGDVP